MSIYTKLKPSKEFEHLEAGSHLARCSAVIAVGLQKATRTDFGDKDTLYLRFEVPAERFEFTRDGQPLANGEVTSVCCELGENMHAIPVPAVIADQVEETPR